MHPLPVQHYLPELTFEFMMDHCPVLPQFSEIMEIGQEIIQKDKAEQCLSVSLFNRSVSDVTGRTKNTPERFQVYLDGLREMLAKVSKMEGDYCVNLFLDPELSIHVPAFIRQCPKLNVFVMKHSSSAATGMFWRFLSFEKQWSMGAETVYSVDLDEDIAATLVKLAGHTPCSCVFYGPDQDLYQSRLLAARYYAPLCGALTALRPVDIELPIADTVARFLYYQTHWQMMVEPRTVYNQPQPGSQFGFANMWNLYGTDEKFLAKVMYYHLRRRGKLNMVCLDSMLKFPTPAFEADWRFTTEHGNRVIAV